VGIDHTLKIYKVNTSILETLLSYLMLILIQSSFSVLILELKLT